MEKPFNRGASAYVRLDDNTYSILVLLTVVGDIKASNIRRKDIFPANNYKKCPCIPRTFSKQSIAPSTLAAKADLAMSRILR